MMYDYSFRFVTSFITYIKLFPCKEKAFVKGMRKLRDVSRKHPCKYKCVVYKRRSKCIPLKKEDMVTIV